jgi:CRISPR/Cas system-associated protein endoribonuclease Cas2
VDYSLNLQGYGVTYNKWQLLEQTIDYLPSQEESGWDKLSIVEKQFVAMRIIEGQVMNGGFPAVYYNDNSHYIALAMEGYQLIQAQSHADILRSLLSSVSRNAKKRMESIEADAVPLGVDEVYDEQWHVLDSRQLAQLKHDYIRTHSNQFSLYRKK